MVCLCFCFNVSHTETNDDLILMIFDTPSASCDILLQSASVVGPPNFFDVSPYGNTDTCEVTAILLQSIAMVASVGTSNTSFKSNNN